MSHEIPPPGDQPPPTHQPNWGSAYPPPGYSAYGPPPKHPQATTSMVLGIVAVAGGLLCWLPILISPAAWIMGAKAVRDIDASRGAQTGRSEAMAGKVLGIVGTVLLLLAVAGIILLIVLAFSVDDFWDGFWDEPYDDAPLDDSFNNALGALTLT